MWSTFLLLVFDQLNYLEIKLKQCSSLRKKSDMTEMMKETGVDSIMVARAAWYNPSIFRDPEPVPVREVSLL